MDWMRPVEKGFDFPQIAWAWLRSFRRSQWKLEDYPLRFRHFDNSGYDGPLDRRPVDWTVRVLQWVAMDGHGSTREEALRGLRDSFDRYLQRGEVLPRPGVYKPIEVASSEKIERFGSIKQDFIFNILRLEWAFVSDESSLWHFSEDSNLDIFYERIKSRYGVDVSDMENPTLVDIFVRLALHRN